MRGRVGRPDGRAGGFTLVEMLVALFVFVVGVLSMAGLLHRTMGASRGAIDHSAAAEVLREKVEELRALPYLRLASGSDGVHAGGVDFLRQWGVAVDTPIPGLAHVEVTVEWAEEGPLLAAATGEGTGTLEELATDPLGVVTDPEDLETLLEILEAEDATRSRTAVLYRSRF